MVVAVVLVSFQEYFELILTIYYLETKNVDLNIRAVFLHVLADALGSVVVIISALLYRYHTYLKIDTKYVRFVDPILWLVNFYEFL